MEPWPNGQDILDGCVECVHIVDVARLRNDSAYSGRSAQECLVTVLRGRVLDDKAVDEIHQGDRKNDQHHRGDDHQCQQSLERFDDHGKSLCTNCRPII